MKAWAFPIGCVAVGCCFLAVATRFASPTSTDGQAGKERGDKHRSLHIYVDAWSLLPEYPEEPGLRQRIHGVLVTLGYSPAREVSDEELGLVKRFLEDARPALEMVERGLRENRPRWPRWKTMQEATSYQFREWSLPRLRELVDMLLGRGALADRDGSPNEALSHYLDSVEFSGDVGRGGLLIEQLCASVWLNKSLKPLLALLAEPGLSAHNLRGSVKRLRRLVEEQEPFAATVRRELKLSEAAMPPSQRESLKPYLKDIGDAAELDYPHWLAFDLSRHWPAPESDDPTKQPYLDPHFWKGGFRKYYEEAQAYLRAATIIAALRLHQMERGQYPDYLEYLVPEYLPQVPTDPFSAAPFLYWRKGSGWIMYSLGPNARDDGGTEDDIPFHAVASR